MQDATPRRMRIQINTAQRWAMIGVLAIAGFFAITISVHRFETSSGIDFYHMWGIAKIPHISDAPLNPYTDSIATANLLNAYSDASEDTRLRRVNALRRSIDPTGTPLFYITFVPFPVDFTTSQTIFTILQYAAFAGAVLLFLQYCGVGWLVSITVLIVSIATFRPFGVDIRVGNVNTFQLLGIVALMIGGQRTSESGMRGYLLVMGAGILTLWKPNILPVTLILLLARGMHLSVPRAASEAAAGVIAVAFAVVLSMVWFADLAIWHDWYGYVSGTESAKLSTYSVADGNLSTAGVLSQVTRSSRAIWTIGIAMFLGSSLLANLHARARRDRRSLLTQIREMARNTGLIVTLGICVTAAAAPLLWRHYLTWVALAPAWLILSRRILDREIALPTVALLLYWEPPGMTALLGASLVDTLQALAWLPVWVVLLERIRKSQSGGTEPGLPSAESP